MIMVNLPSLRSTVTLRLQSSVNIYHILDILKFENKEKFDTLVAMYFTSRDEAIHKKLLDLLCINKVHFANNPDSVQVIASLLPNCTALTDDEKETMVMIKVQKDVFSHLSFYFDSNNQEEATCMRNSNKVHILAYCTAMLLEHHLGLRSESCRDSWSNKRIEASSKDMEYLLKNAFDSKMSHISAH